MRVTTTSILSPDQLHDRRVEATKIVANRRRIKLQSVVDTYREQLRPHVDGVGQFDALLTGWLVNGSDELKTVLLNRSDPDDRSQIESFFNHHAHDTPRAAIDLSEPPPTMRMVIEVYRIIRDTPAAHALKALHEHVCQLCGDRITLPDGSWYSEVHHIVPLGDPHCGPDVWTNMLVLCPNDHARCDLGAIQLDSTRIATQPGHIVSAEYIDYHNTQILRF